MTNRLSNSISAPPPPAIDALLAAERELTPLPVEVEARGLRRAERALREQAAAGATIGRAAFLSLRPWRLAAAMVGGLLLVGVTALAYQAGVLSGARRAEPAGKRAGAAPLGAAAVHPSPRLAAAPFGFAAARAARAGASVTEGEVAMLDQARAAMARGELAEALQAVSAHEQTFPQGRLVEEREAMRVRVLSGLGSKHEARAALREFAARFPRSLLLPTLRVRVQ